MQSNQIGQAKGLASKMRGISARGLDLRLNILPTGLEPHYLTLPNDEHLALVHTVHHLVCRFRTLCIHGSTYMKPEITPKK